MTDPTTTAHSIPANEHAAMKVISSTVRVGLYTGALLTIVMVLPHRRESPLLAG
jgi:hypothetical protein